MSYLLITIIVILAAGIGFLYWKVLQQQAAIDRTMESIKEQYRNTDPEMFLTVKVLDPIEVAKRESRSARVVADRLPVMVTKMVYQRVQEELEQEMADRDIRVKLKIEYR
ncbi:MAG: hypothetical protein R3175_03130 [Marinobacter sp.]|uniref:hypothetical protein n=1 Tax=Marinobacter sp. TaxID=50741 RepID=UPI00299DB9AC|nr:hypothetical protein [Marinobacter sp.]MDX1755032.1 hypothetical protein [Marinobacter sp.]